MIVGLFVRNYKCYKNLNFIPFSESPRESLNVFIGSNGSGKSSILEAINCIMNEVDPKTWETTVSQKKDRTYIAPVFLIPKISFPCTSQYDAISDAFWNTDFSTSSHSDATAQFIAWRKELSLKVNKEDYYLICIGKNYGGNVLLTSTFHEKIFNQTRRFGVSRSVIGELFKKILLNYSYIYIPVENRISDVLSLQASEMQGLMDKSVVSEIKGILSAKEHGREGERKESVVDLINKKLDEYLEEINLCLSHGYKFVAQGAKKKTIKPADILKVVVSEYFGVRPLTKDAKHIKSLSSGQQRLALIDVASTLLLSEAEKNRSVILAIDEPESSLEDANRFKQFSRLVEIGERSDHQVLLTTHWYGLLLRPSKGRLSYVSSSNEVPDVKGFSLENLYDQRRKFPDSMEMKSYFDLMSSMLSLLKQEEFNWIICEGYEDSLYLKHHLEGRIDNLHILPFNGCGNVKKLYGFLSVPFSDKKELSEIKGKVYCLIDNDEKNVITIPTYSASLFGGKLRFERLLLNRESWEADVISVANPNATNTCIEDVLDPEVMWGAFNLISQRKEEFSDLLDGFSFNPDVPYVDITKRVSFMRKETVAAYEKIDKIQSVASNDSFKRALAVAYVEVGVEMDKKRSLPWVERIVDFFGS